LLSLLAPIKRVTGYDTIMPFARLEQAYLPTAERIATAAREVLEAA
jgi:pyruvate dehydrogenase E1 component beta subunit